MGCDRSAPQRTANLNLNANLVEQCRSGVNSFSAYVDAVRATDLAQGQDAADAERTWTERAVEAFAVLYHEHGSLSEEMQSL